MSAGGITAGPPVAAAPPASGSGESRFSRALIVLFFLGPAAFLLIVWMVYPAIYTILRSFFGPTGFLGHWVGIQNYKTVFVPFNSTNPFFTAIKNNFLWVLIVPATVSAIGLVFAVMIERVRWSVAFKTAVFVPMAISAFATGVTWRILYDQNPDTGAINALGRIVHDKVSPPGVLPSALPSTPTLQAGGGGSLVLKTPLHPGDVAHLGLTGITPTAVPKSAVQAVSPPAKQGDVVGVVWRDFRPGGGKPGVVEKGELGLPGVNVELRSSDGKVVQTATAQSDGTFDFKNVPAGTYQSAVAASTFSKPFGGYAWLGPTLITASLMISYIWIWAGFAMVVIAAGLASMPRDVLEAARTDGATELQIFRRVTVPLLAPVLSVVFITMIINVLKVFDIVYALAPESVQSNANVLALSMYNTAFAGGGNFGVGSTIAVVLFVLVIPVLALNLRRFKRDV